jgi:glycosyltransferase involved in cell wall biosynthesis
MKLAYYCSNRTIFPPPKDIVAANAQVMFDIVNGMIKKGHDVTIYASKGSHVDGAKIVDLGLLPHELDYAYQNEEWVKDIHIGYRLAYISDLIAHSAQYDLIHLHVGRAIFGEPFLKFAKCPVIFTIHETLISHLEPLMNLYPKANLISISDAQRKIIPSLNYISTIYHGVDINKFPFNPKPDRGLLFLSRVSKEKGVEFAIKVAQKTNSVLDICGPGDEDYLKSAVRPYLNDKIKYHGMVKYGSLEWYQAYSQAKAFLFPVQWEESFGLVMIEALACGTPVIAFNRGSVSEIIKDGETGFIIEPGDINGMAAAVKKIDQIDRAACRKHVEENFTIEKMIDNYEKIYQKIITND